MLTVNLCQLCGSPTKPFHPGTISVQEYFSKEPMYTIAAGELEQRLPIVVCTKCGHGQTPIDIPAEKIARWYAAADKPDEAFLKSEKARRKTAQKILKRMQKYLGRGGLLMDVGAGPGIFAAEAQRAGWQVHGVEPAKWGVEHARQSYGLDFFQAGFETLEQLPAGAYDAVTMFDVIEHVVEPQALLSAAARVTREGGLLVLTTPRFDSLMARLLGTRWYDIFPAHIHYFTRRSMTNILKKAGYQIVEERLHTRHLPVNYLVWRAALMTGLPTFNNKLPVDLSSWILPINLGDEFEIYARRRG